MTLARDLARNLSRDIQRGIASGLGESFTYDSLAAAESSGDVWSSGDIITANGVEFVYQSSLTSDGYSGLIHRYPYGTGLGTLSSVDSVEHSEAEGADPDTWTGFTNASAGTKGVDYDFDVNSGRARFRDLTITGRASLNSTNTVGTGDTETFLIIDRLTETNTYASTARCSVITIIGYSATLGEKILTRLDARGTGVTGNWYVNHTDTSTWTDTGQSKTSEARFFLYMKHGRWAVWVDGGSSPAATGTVPDPVGTGVLAPFYVQGGNDPAPTASLEMGAFVMGYMTTA